MNASMEGTLSLLGNLTTHCECANLEVQYQVQPPMSLTGMIIVSTNSLWRAVAGSVKIAPSYLVTSPAYFTMLAMRTPFLKSRGSMQMVLLSLGSAHFCVIHILIHYHMESIDGFHPGWESFAHS